MTEDQFDTKVNAMADRFEQSVEQAAARFEGAMERGARKHGRNLRVISFALSAVLLQGFWLIPGTVGTVFGILGALGLVGAIIQWGIFR